MADLYEDCREHLLTNQAMRNLIGTRAYPDVLPQDVELPAVVVRILNDEPGETLSGHSSLEFARIQFDCLAESRQDAHRTADALEAVLDGYRGPIGIEEQHYVRGAELDNRFDRFDRPTSGDDRFRYRTTVDMVLPYSVLS